MIQDHKISRRDFARVATLAGLVAPFGVLCAGCKEKDAANELISKFPSNLPGARDIHPIPVSDAKFILVHIRQNHETPTFGVKNQNVAAIEKTVKDCQEDIRAIFGGLAGKFPIDALYVEGLTKELLALTADAVKTASTLMREAPAEKVREFEKKLSETSEVSLATGMFVSAAHNIPIREAETARSKEITDKLWAPADRIETIDRRVREIGSIYEESVAGRRKLSESDLKGLEQELIVANKEVVEVTEKWKRLWSSMQDELHTVREDQLLSLLNPSEVPAKRPFVAVAIFGGHHDFADNVEHYNKKNPNAKIALVTITPTRLAGD